MKEIELDNGLKLSIDEGIMDDAEILDALSDLSDGDGLAISRLTKRLLGKDGKEKLYESLRTGGRVKTTEVTKALMEIFEKLGEQAKN